MRGNRCSLGRKRPEHERENIRQKMKGNTNGKGNKGRTDMAVHIATLAEINKVVMVGNTRWKKQRRLLGLRAAPTRPELAMQGILESLAPGEWEYVGLGQVFICDKNPDFLHKTRKLIVEVFGDYWHRNEVPGERESVFAKEGYATLVVWEREIKSDPGIVGKIKTFISKEE
jgi:G:T-mismatch repair DNA endonuclease (very short patch repair protein)